MFSSKLFKVQFLSNRLHKSGGYNVEFMSKIENMIKHVICTLQ